MWRPRLCDPALLNMLDRVWRNTTERNMHLTGGIGPSAQNEGFTVDYDCPTSLRIRKPVLPLRWRNGTIASLSSMATLVTRTSSSAPFITARWPASPSMEALLLCESPRQRRQPPPFGMV